MSSPTTHIVNGLRIAVEGCGHGTLNAIYASVKKASTQRGWDGVDLLVIGGDFQAVRNASDLTVMSCPVKYRAIGDFHAYYSGITKAPYLTMFVGGNHEASNHLWELLYGGWVAPNIYYMGRSNVVRVNGVRIAGMSGIWKGYNYQKNHHERLPYSQDDVKSIYHVRELDIRKLHQLRSQVDIGISHDWPRGIESHGNAKHLWNMKPDFEQESKDGTLGNQAATFVMDRLRPPYWFAAHMHCKFSAVKTYGDDVKSVQQEVAPTEATLPFEKHEAPPSALPTVAHNEDEIDLDMDDEEVEAGTSNTTNPKPEETAPTSVSSDLRAQLPAAFSRPPQSHGSSQREQPGQPTPPEVTNKTVRFLALDKCLPGRKFLQLLEIQPYNIADASCEPQLASGPRPEPTFEYDPEWLAITRVFNNDYRIGDKNASASINMGEVHYKGLIEQERKWVEEHVVKQNKLEIPRNFAITAPPFYEGMPEIINDGPLEYNNPQMQEFCDLIGVENRLFATDEEKQARMERGPAPVAERPGRDFGNRGRGRGRGGGRGGGGRGYGRGRGRGR